MVKQALLLVVLIFTVKAFGHAGSGLIVSGGSEVGVWSTYTKSEEINITRLLELLARSETGEKLIKEARVKAAMSGMTLHDLLKSGEGSLTDTTLIRKFHPQDPENVVFETRSQVFINRHLAYREALLDLAHELTHYVYREAFNPYTVTFAVTDFIKSTIEGQGGEVHAFVTECQVMKELFTREYVGNSNCAHIEDDGQLSHLKARQLFYQVGAFYDSIKRHLGERGVLAEFPELSNQKIKFVSSAYGVPYPLAAFQEYQTVLGKVCENDKRRLAYMQQDGQGRSPASLQSFKKGLEERCSKVSLR